MARKVIKVNLELDRIHCFDEGDGWGDAEPYLWTVFFKIDGETVQLTESLMLSGPPTTENTPGSHGNLGDTDVDAGDDVTIPVAIGEWETFLKPIPVPASLSSVLEDLGGVVGVVVILMEEDNVSDEGAEAGHQALNAAVRDALQEIISTRSLTNQDVSDEEIQGFTDTIQSKVKDAVVNQQNVFENIWSWLNPDDTIGVKVFVFKHDDLDPATTQEFSHRWHNEGDWELFGHITSTPLCPVNALSGLFAHEASRADAASSGSPSMSSGREAGKGTEVPYDIEAMRVFRDGPYRSMPGLDRWFGLVELHAGRVVRLALTRPELLPSARKMVEWGTLMARKPDTPLSMEHVEHARRLLTALSQHRHRRARIDAKRALSVLEVLGGKTHREAMQFLAAMPPARHPTLGRNSCVRVLRRTRSEDLDTTTKPEC